MITDAVLVSDSDALRTLVQFALGKYWGLQLRHATTGDEASAKVTERTPQLILVDAASSGFSADFVVGALRQTAPSASIFALNADAPVSGSHACIDSPFQPQKLHAAIDSRLSQ